MRHQDTNAAADFMTTGHPPSNQADHPPGPSKVKFQRARSLPNSRPFRVAVFFASLHYLGLILCATALWRCYKEPSETASRILLGGIAFSALTWIIAFFKRRNVFCPLCKGTPLLNSGARPHLRARRILPLNHGTTAILSILAVQKFRCMYCGSDFDLLKTPSHLRGMGGDSGE